MSFLDIFKQAPVTAPQALPPAAPAPAPGGTAKLADATPAIVPVTTPGTAPNGVVPNNVQEIKSPLDQFPIT